MSIEESRDEIQQSVAARRSTIEVVAKVVIVIVVGISNTWGTEYLARNLGDISRHTAASCLGVFLIFPRASK